MIPLEDIAGWEGERSAGGIISTVVSFFRDSSGEHLQSLCNLSENVLHLSSYFKQSVTLNPHQNIYVNQMHAMQIPVCAEFFEVDIVSELCNEPTLGPRLLLGGLVKRSVKMSYTYSTVQSSHEK